VQKVFTFLNRKTVGLHQAAFILASASVAAKILALLRDRILASFFGAGKQLDIYYASFRVPDFLYVFSLFIVSVTALIPIFLEKEKDKARSRSFINGMFTVFFFVIAISAVVAFFLMPYLADFFTPGFSPEGKTRWTLLSRILLFSPLLLGFSNLVSSVVQAKRYFFIYALSGVLYNLGIIFGLLVFYPFLGIKGVVWGVVLGALLHFLIQAPFLVKFGYFPKFNFRISFSDVKKVVSLSLPRTLGLTLNQIVLTAITAIASFLAAGSIAVFNLSLNLESIPLGVFALSYGVAAFPMLARKFLDKQREEFISVVVSSIRHIIFWLLPITVLLIVLRAQIVRVILGAGAFGWADTRLTAASLALLSLSLCAQGLVYLLVRAFYAASKTKTPLLINLASSFVIVIFSVFFLWIFKNSEEIRVVFEKIFRVEGMAGTSMLILPLAFSLGSLLNCILLWFFFEKDFGLIFKRIKKSLFQILLASALMATVVYGSLNIFDNIFNLKTFKGIFLQGFLSGLLGSIFIYFVLKIFKNKELLEISSSLRQKFLKPSPVKPELEELP
jgi:putative peptidoglycan lipid II flippase